MFRLLTHACGIIVSMLTPVKFRQYQDCARTDSFPAPPFDSLKSWYEPNSATPNVLGLALSKEVVVSTDDAARKLGWISAIIGLSKVVWELDPTTSECNVNVVLFERFAFS